MTSPTDIAIKRKRLLVVMKRYASLRTANAIFFGLAVPIATAVALGIEAFSTQTTALKWPVIILVTLASWTTGAVLEVIVKTAENARDAETVAHEMFRQAKKLRGAWSVSSRFQARLVKMKDSYAHIEIAGKSRPNVFADYYDRRIAGLCDQMVLSANSNELKINQTHFDTTDVLLSCLTDGERDKFEAIHLLRNNAFLHQVPHARRYLMALERKIAHQEIQCVRRIFVIDDDRKREQLADSFTRAYVAFHRGESNKFHCQLMLKSRFKQIFGDQDVDTQMAEDFGIYGDWYVYETSVANDQAIEGTFIAREDKVKQYQKLFGELWDDAYSWKHFSRAKLPEVSTANDVFRLAGDRQADSSNEEAIT